MSMQGFDESKIEKLASLLQNKKRIVITCHLSPDGDALGSSLGLKSVLSQLNPSARVSVLTPDEPSRTLAFLPGFDSIKALSHYPDSVAALIEECDLLVCLDFNELGRTDRLAPLLERCGAEKVLIDHHLDPENFADLVFSRPGSPATCMLLFEVLRDAKLLGYINTDAANCLLAGMMTDTINFTVNISRSDIFFILGELIDMGADKLWLDRMLFGTHSETFLRIQGYALARKMELFYDTHAALITVTRDELNEYNYKKGDTEGLVNHPLAVPGILYSCFLREETDYIKVSMRSLGNFPVNELCSRYFNGGGHLNAAGGEFIGTMDECVAIFKSILTENKRKYIDGNKVLERLLAEKK